MVSSGRAMAALLPYVQAQAQLQREETPMNAIIQFTVVGFAIAGSIAVALLIEWLSLWGLMQLMPARQPQPARQLQQLQRQLQPVRVMRANSPTADLRRFRQSA
jgi:hypothetical protein